MGVYLFECVKAKLCAHVSEVSSKAKKLPIIMSKFSLLCSFCERSDWYSSFLSSSSK